MGFAAAALPYVAAGATVVGTIASMNAAQQQADAQAKAAQYQAQVAANNQKIANYNASLAEQQGQQQLQASREESAQQMGAIRAAMGASGLDLNSGSALRNQQGLAQVSSLNESTITSNAARSAWNYRNQGADYGAQSALYTQQAQQAQKAGITSQYATLLSGAGQFASQAFKYDLFK